MKKILLLILLYSTYTAQAQYNNNGRQRVRDYTQQTQQKVAEPDFKIKRYLGIVNYDIKRAAKKTSINTNSTEGKQFLETLKVYNKRIKDITRINSFLLSSTKKMIDSYQKKSNKTGDYSDQPKIIKKMSDNLKPLTETLKKEDKNLDTSIKSILSKKQYKKWIKYNKKIYKIFPKE